MKHFFSTLTTVFIVSVLGFAASGQSQFSKVVFEGQSYCVEEGLNHNFVIAGSWQNKAMVFMINSAGTIQWSKTIGDENSCFYGMTPTRDSCFILAGYAIDSTGMSDILCMKIDQSGVMVWTKKIDLGQSETAYAVVQTKDGGYAITGDFDMIKLFVVKLDADGNISWEKVFLAGSLENRSYGIKETPDSGYVVTGLYENNPPPDIGFFLAKLTKNGDVSWAKRQVSSSPDYRTAIGYDIYVLSDGILNYSYVGDAGLILYKTDFSGNYLWGKKYGLSWDSYLGPKPRLRPTSDGGYLFVFGQPMAQGGMLKTDQNGNVSWCQSLFLSPLDAIETTVNGFLVVGNGPLMGVKNQHEYLGLEIGIIKTDLAGVNDTCSWNYSATAENWTANFEDVTLTPMSVENPIAQSFQSTSVALTGRSGCVDMTGGISENSFDDNEFTIFPNPTDRIFTLTSNHMPSDEVKQIAIFNMFGEQVFETSFSGDHIKVDIGDVPDGIYNIKVIFRHSVASKNLMILH